MRADEESELRAEFVRHGAAVASMLAMAAGDAYAAPERGQGGELTQLALATAEAMIRGTIRFRGGHQPDPREQLWLSYVRWAGLQGMGLRAEARGPAQATGWLATQPFMRSRRPQGETTRAALAQLASSEDSPDNDSKGSACLPRATALGLCPPIGGGNDAMFGIAAESARLTHGNPAAALCTGVFATTIRHLCEEKPLEVAILEALDLAQLQSGPTEVPPLAELQQRIQIALSRAHGGGAYDKPSQFGGWLGYTAEEALPLALWAAMRGETLEGALGLVTAHRGERRTTAAACGALWGARAGARAAAEAPPVPELGKHTFQPAELIGDEILDGLEARGLVEVVTEDMLRICRSGSEIRPADRLRWPGI